MNNTLINQSISYRNESLCFCEHDLVKLAKKYGTPLYVMSEDIIRSNCRKYINAMRKYFGDNAMPLYAGKAAAFKKIYGIMKEEGMGIDVVSSGEIYTANAAGYPLENAYFHGNNKTDEDINYAIDCGVGYFVADNFEELDAINSICKARGIVQDILIRITPGIDPHTYDAVATGKVDSKFGSAIETGQAEKITEYALSLSNVCLRGFHCHVGSQVLDSSVYLSTSNIMLEFVAKMKERFGYETEQLDLGGGYGVRYIHEHKPLDIDKSIKEVAAFIYNKAAELSVKVPKILMEPGRSIVGDAGVTLYTVGTVKTIPGYKTYVSVDGGMTDNPRFALYKSPYTVLAANRIFKNGEICCSVVGRCCESGDIIQENVILPKEICRGDILAVLTTGAYNYSMSSNYNRIPRPPVIMLNGDKDYIAVKRETFEDVIANDM